MLSLNIDTSQNITSVSVSSEKEILHLLEEDNERPNHCELLSPMIKKLFNIYSPANSVDVKKKIWLGN